MKKNILQINVSTVTISKKELDRLKIVKKFISKDLS